MIFHTKEWNEFVAFIGNGWAPYSLIEVCDCRQLLSLRLPGDTISKARLWQDMPERAVEPLTGMTPADDLSDANSWRCFSIWNGDARWDAACLSWSQRRYSASSHNSPSRSCRSSG